MSLREDLSGGSERLPPTLLSKQLDEVIADKVKLTDIYWPEDLPTDPDESPNPQLAIAEGLTITRQQKATLPDGRTITWQERVLIVRSKAWAAKRAHQFEARLHKIEAQLQALTPPAKQGRRQFSEAAPLRQAIDALLESEGMTDCFAVKLEREVTTRSVRAYANKPARIDL